MTAPQTVAAFLTALMALAPPSSAQTVTNTDATEHTLTISVDGRHANQTIAPGITLRIACNGKCVIGLAYAEVELEVSEGEALEIVNGALLRSAQ